MANVLEGTEAWTKIRVLVTPCFQSMDRTGSWCVSAGKVRHTFGSGEVNDVAILLEHVDLLNSLDWLDVQLLKRSLQLLVVGAGGLVDLLRLPSGRALATNASRQILVSLESCHIKPSWSSLLDSRGQGFI
jgi:hypothetical protein